MDKYIACTTKKQWKDVLKKFEEEGYKWIVGNSVLSGLDYFSSYKSESVIHVHPDIKRLEFGNKDFYKGCGIKTFISAHDFLKDAKTKPIVISRNGRVITAEDKNTGDKAIAICCPSDEFDFSTGAMIALSRLIVKSGKSITKDAETAMRELLGDNSSSSTETVTTTEFHVGDLVTLKKGIKSGKTYGSLALLTGIMYDGAYGKPLKVTRGRSAHGTYLCEPVDGGIDFYYSEQMLESWKSERSIADDNTEFTDEIKVGNRVKIREWDDMKEEFGADSWGYINSPVSFNPSMKEYCGKIAEITQIDEFDGTFRISLDKDREWWFDENMIVKSKKDDSAKSESVPEIKKNDDEIHEGDTVRITDTGKQYTTYNEWIKSNITDVDLICKFDYNRDASRDIEYVVVKIAEHGMHNKTLAYIREKADLWPRCYLIDVKGLEKVTK